MIYMTSNVMHDSGLHDVIKSVHRSGAAVKNRVICIGVGEDIEILASVA